MTSVCVQDIMFSNGWDVTFENIVSLSNIFFFKSITLIIWSLDLWCFHTSFYLNISEEPKNTIIHRVFQYLWVIDITNSKHNFIFNVTNIKTWCFSWYNLFLQGSSSSEREKATVVLRHWDEIINQLNSIRCDII